MEMSAEKASYYLRKGQKELNKEKGGGVFKIIELVCEAQAKLMKYVTTPKNLSKKTRPREHKNQQVFDWQKDWIRKEREVI